MDDVISWIAGIIAAILIAFSLFFSVGRVYAMIRSDKLRNDGACPICGESYAINEYFQRGTEWIKFNCENDPKMHGDIPKSWIF